jgi:carbonic anhydrase
VIAAADALARLVAGNRRFVAEMAGTRPQTIGDRDALAQGQAPWAAFLCCGDSRTTPEIVFNLGLGDAFVCRVAGNVATSLEMAGLQFASAIAGANLIVVMGHSECAAVQTAIEASLGKALPSEDLVHLARAIEPAVRRFEGHRMERTAVVKANVAIGVDRLRRDALLSALCRERGLEIVGAYHDLASGVVQWM